jgi:hypothetical protein
MDRMEAVAELEELAEEIYDRMERMKEVIREVAPEELERARSYWLAHMDGALLKQDGWLGGSLFCLQDTISAIEEGAEDDDSE